MGELAKIKPTALTHSCEPELSEKLRDLLNAPGSFNDLPVVGPKTAAILQAYADHPEPAPASDDEIDDAITALAHLPKRQGSVSDAHSTMTLWGEQMRDIPAPDLRAGVQHIMRTARFFPSPAEIHHAANRTLAWREYRRMQAKMLIEKHKRKWRPPIDDPADPKAVRQLIEQALGA